MHEWNYYRYWFGLNQQYLSLKYLSFCCHPIYNTTNTQITINMITITVQHECIPQAVLGFDIICQAKSGMGKTAVFVREYVNE